MCGGAILERTRTADFCWASFLESARTPHTRPRPTIRRSFTDLAKNSYQPDDKAFHTQEETPVFLHSKKKPESNPTNTRKKSRPPDKKRGPLPPLGSSKEPAPGSRPLPQSSGPVRLVSKRGERSDPFFFFWGGGGGAVRV